MHQASDYLFTIDADKINSPAPHPTFHNGSSQIKGTDNDDGTDDDDEDDDDIDDDNDDDHADKINSGAPHLTFHNGFSQIKETDNSPNNVLTLILSYAFSSSLAFTFSKLKFWAFVFKVFLPFFSC